MAASVAMAALVGWASTQPPLGEGLDPVPAVAVAGLAWVVTGALLVTLRPRNRIGWLLVLVGALQSVSNSGNTYGAFGTRADPPWPYADWVGLLTVMIYFPSLLLQANVLLALYPTGRLPARWWRWPVLGVVIAMAVLTVGATFSQDSYDDVGAGQAPAVLPTGWWTTVGVVACFATIICGTVTIWVATAVRLVRARGPQRVQLAWLVAAVIPLTLGAFFVPLPRPVLAVVALLVPVAVGVGVIRYRLLGIVLRPALTYGTLTAAVVGVYFCVSAFAGSLLDHGRLPGVVAAALVAVGITPLRDRLQLGVDRFVYGARRDPLEAVTRVGGTVAAEGDALAGVLAGVADAVRAPWAAVVAVDGRPVAVARPDRGYAAGEVDVVAGGHEAIPLLLEGQRIGELQVGHRHHASPFTPDDRRVLGLLAPQVAVVLRAVDLMEALQVERDRVVAATRSERQRLGRDLHDGLGPALAGIGLGLQAIDDAITAADATTAQAIVGRLREEVTTTVNDVRRIIDDLRPVTLDELGLVNAVRRHADSVNGAVEVSLDIDDLPTLTLPVEAATYRITQEALTNVVRHANARTASVAMTRAQLPTGRHELVVTIADDGSGMTGPGAGTGVGLPSMRRRAESVGGSLEVRSGRGGTTVVARLPIEDAS
ncbi:histidine kinase [Micromonospora sp. NPDC004540]|uniref:histidine kinase n=1 Tax=Micromonospora sp. NPDC004540 TaxID=3154457 RepID=UPI0033BF5532